MPAPQRPRCGLTECLQVGRVPLPKARAAVWDFCIELASLVTSPSGQGGRGEARAPPWYQPGGTTLCPRCPSHSSQAPVSSTLSNLHQRAQLGVGICVPPGCCQMRAPPISPTHGAACPALEDIRAHCPRAELSLGDCTGRLQ